MKKPKYEVIYKESINGPGHMIYACMKDNKRVKTLYVPWEADAWLEHMNRSI